MCNENIDLFHDILFFWDVPVYAKYILLFVLGWNGISTYFFEISEMGLRSTCSFSAAVVAGGGV